MAKEPLASGPKLLAKNTPVIMLNAIIIPLPESIIAELKIILLLGLGINLFEG